MDENQSKVKNVDEEVNLREEVKARQNTKYFIHPITMVITMAMKLESHRLSV